MAQLINPGMQHYFVKMAPDFSIFDLVEKYFYDNNLAEGMIRDIFFIKSDSGLSAQTSINRGMFLVYSEGDLSIQGSATDEYTVFPYKDEAQVIIAVKDGPISIVSTSAIDLIVGVAF
jgi:hypothetical protein